MDLLTTVDAINLGRRDRVVTLARAAVGGDLSGKRVAVLGAAFKPNSDDIRDSPSLAISGRLADEGAIVAVHDPVAMANAARVRPDLRYADSVHEAAKGADLVLHLTEWADYRAIDPDGAALDRGEPGPDRRPVHARRRRLAGRRLDRAGPWPAELSVTPARRGVRRPAASAGSSRTMPGGPSTTRSAASATCGDLRALAGDGAAGDALGAQLADRGEGREVPEVITAEQHGAGRALRGKPPQGGSLVHARRPELKHQPAGFEGERGAVGEPAERLAQQRERRRRVRRPPGVDGERRALVLHGGSLGRARLGEQPGQRLAHGLDARRHGGGAEHARLPALRAVVTEHDQAGHIGEAAKRHRVRGGPAGDDRHGADPARQPGQRGDGAGRGHRRGRVVDDGREGAVVVGGDERARRVGRHRGKAGLAVRRSLRAGSGHRYLVPGCAANVCAGGGLAAPAAA